MSPAIQPFKQQAERISAPCSDQVPLNPPDSIQHLPEQTITEQHSCQGIDITPPIDALGRSVRFTISFALPRIDYPTRSLRLYPPSFVDLGQASCIVPVIDSIAITPSRLAIWNRTVARSGLTGGIIGGPWRSILFQIAHCCPAGRLIAPEAGRNSINFANKFITLFDRGIYIRWRVRERERERGGQLVAPDFFYFFVFIFIICIVIINYAYIIEVLGWRGGRMDNLLLDFSSSYLHCWRGRWIISCSCINRLLNY